jgi:hypothetical protein
MIYGREQDKLICTAEQDRGLLLLASFRTPLSFDDYVTAAAVCAA